MLLDRVVRQEVQVQQVQPDNRDLRELLVCEVLRDRLVVQEPRVQLDLLEVLEHMDQQDRQVLRATLVVLV